MSYLCTQFPAWDSDFKLKLCKDNDYHLNTFKSLGLEEPILKALEKEGYKTPTPIQQQAIPLVLDGRDLLGCAQTGTGKTAAFALPIIQSLHLNPPKQQGRRPIRTLVLTPTRELAIQIGESFAAYGKFAGLRHTVIFGGVNQNPQVRALQAGIDILVATPGRLIDLINQKHVFLGGLEIFVLDEADRMLDMGFVHDVKRIIALLPGKRQSLFFSATMPPVIQKLADTILTRPMKVEVTPPATTAQTISQSVFFVDKANKGKLLINLLKQGDINRVLVFIQMKHKANKLTADIQKAGFTAEAIHGNKSQVARQNALNNFKNHKTKVLVATDIAARGIDVDDLTHVINFELPNVPETYVHRIGRTGRAGAEGRAISFCDDEETVFLRDIQKLTGVELEIDRDSQFYNEAIEKMVNRPGRPTSAPAAKKHQGGQQRQGGQAKQGGSSNNFGKKKWFKPRGGTKNAGAPKN
jgi:ATP-dependent RNA helicase RhlE